MQIIKNRRALCVSVMAEICKIATEQPMDIRSSATPSGADDACDKAFPQLEERRMRLGPDHRQNGVGLVHPVDFHHPKVPLRLRAFLFNSGLGKSLGCLHLKMYAKPGLQEMESRVAALCRINLEAQETAHSTLHLLSGIQLLQDQPIHINTPGQQEHCF